MRTTPIIAVAAFAAGCASENELRYTATLQAETRGVVLSDDGLDAYAAMSGTTCTIDVNWGCPVADEDLPTDEEQVVDQHAAVTVGMSSRGMHTLQHGSWDEAADVAVADARTGRLSDAGLVVVAGTEDDCWIQRGDEQVAAPAAACAEGAHHEIDRVTGTLYVAGAHELWSLGPAVDRQLDVPGELISWDAGVQRLYVAEAGSEELVALEPGGEVAWIERTRGAIHEVAARGERGEVLVMVDRDDGLGSIERRTGDSGRLLGRSVIPTTDGEIVTSRNGVRMAVVRAGEVSFFALETDGEKAPIDDTPPECIAFEFASQPLFD